MRDWLYQNLCTVSSRCRTYPKRLICRGRAGKHGEQKDRQHKKHLLHKNTPKEKYKKVSLLLPQTRKHLLCGRKFLSRVHIKRESRLMQKHRFLFLHIIHQRTG